MCAWRVKTPKIMHNPVRRISARIRLLHQSGAAFSMSHEKHHEGNDMMEETQFESQWCHIQDQRAAKQEKVNGYFDQEAAKLFERCGWTQQRIADKVGKSQPRVRQLLTYGRFLAFSTTGTNLTIPANLTERAFRSYWEAVPKQAKEAKRFAAVVTLMESDEVVSSKPKTRKAAVLAACSDGKFHTVERIAEMANCEVDEALQTIKYMKRKPSSVHIEDNNSKHKPKYKIQPGSGKKIDLAVVLDKLEPHLVEMERQGKATSAAEYAPSVILSAVAKLRKVLEECSE